jgi:hypothetical protein
MTASPLARLKIPTLMACFMIVSAGAPAPAADDGKTLVELPVDRPGDMLDLCLDPELSTAALIEHLLADGWRPVELDEAAAAIKPTDGQDLTPEQLVAVGMFVLFNIFEDNKPRGYSLELTRFYENTQAGTLRVFQLPRTQVFFRDRPEIIAIRTPAPFTTRRVECVYSVAEEYYASRIFSNLGGSQLNGQSVRRQRNNIDEGDPITSSASASVSGKMLSEAYSADLPGFTIFNVSFDLRKFE